MRKIISLLAISGLAAGLALVAVAPAGASVGAKTSKFCKAVKNFDSSGLGNPTSEDDAAEYAKELKKLGRKAKGKTKAAINEMVDAYEQIADGESPTDVFSDGDFVSAAATFGLAVVKCGIAEIPDITLPDIDIPDITLPDLGS